MSDGRLPIVQVKVQEGQQPGEQPDCLIMLGGVPVGRLPITYADYTMRSYQPNILRIELYVGKASVEG